MPTCRRKRVLLTEPSPELLAALRTDPNREVYYLAQTGEIFETYEAYVARMSFYRLKQFQCEVTGKSGLDYFEALASERQEAQTMHTRFPGPLKPAVLKAVQWQVMGRLDHLVEAVYDRFKDRYYPDERVLIDIQGDKFLARVIQVIPPKASAIASTSRASPLGPSSSSSSPLSDVEQPIHKLAEDLKIPVKDSIARDDPVQYVYRVQILDEEQQPGAGRSHDKHKGKEAAKWSGAVMDVDCSVMSRDRLTFSKSILRRFIRDCVDRAPAVASPWTVKPAIAERYGVNTVMPEETRAGVESIKKGEIDKRKKIWEDKEGPVTKKQRKMTAAAEEKVKALAAAAEQREREERAKAEKVQKHKEEMDRLAAEKKKKKPLRYPTEDLDIVIGDREKKAGMKLQRPIPSRAAMPFGHDMVTNEGFLMSWNFLVVFGQPLHISPFTMDEFEQAVRHSVVDPPCTLLAEVHATLIYNLRTVPFNRHSATLSLIRTQDDAQKDDDLAFGVSVEQLTSAMADVGNNWERAPLRHSEGREGWEESLVGCLKDHANYGNFPRIREILTRLLFAPESVSELSSSTAVTPASSPAPVSLSVPMAPSLRYYSLPPTDRVAILYFMCNLAISSKAIHVHMEWCEEQLTALRKEKIEVNRTKKQYLEEMHALNGDLKANATSANGGDEDAALPDSSDLSEVPGSDGETETPSAARKETRRTAAKERELARAKQASVKQALAEHRRLDEEVNKLERRLEGIEREFRKLLGSIRVKPLGRDRFYNRVWWFDGMGAASLIGSGGSVHYGTGRVFVQGPSEFDIEILQRREEDVNARRKEEEGEEGMLGVGEWAAYNDVEEVEAFVAWLNPKGVRELALKNTTQKWWSHIAPGIRKRTADLASNAKTPETRRSTRKHAGADLAREPYMLWTNRKAVNGS
ncbi:chromatin remodeling complex protein [Laetiporus sulphureus 93-53]|uniref:Chromatin remodeling complex protein n=1 Tax=Laetiporus sulphureus 93-53 TaxID=1314785 RepID=A0A165EEJ2_9APHY|nr:chromatin remodeling complex protein [Laetiporus sulphureus 93-53]KZT06884.1 chromatin remodeling complex protein [Laetiporus sulphureus 93-53]